MKTAIIYDKWLSGMGGGEVVACNMARVLKDSGYDVIFACGKIVSPQIIKDKLKVDLSDITFKEVHNEHDLRLLTSNPDSLTPDLFINISFMDYSYGNAKKNIYYVHFPSKIRSGLFNYVLYFLQKTNLQSLFPNLLKERINDRLRAGIYINMQKRLDSYDIIVANSQFTQYWIKKYWNKDSYFLYPPVSLLTSNPQSPISKHNWICSVGRFFTLGHGKKQEIMIEAFKRLTEAVKDPPAGGGETASVNSGWELHLVGGVGDEPSSKRFMQELQKQTEDYPIKFHFNAQRNEVEEILLKSKIYWHAAGFGENLEKDPIKFEHFGIAPIEAISAGCIPILFDGGGLREIIELLGFDRKLNLFSTIEELVSKTLDIMNNKSSPLPQSLQKKVHQIFSQKRFKEEFSNLLA